MVPNSVQTQIDQLNNDLDNLFSKLDKYTHEQLNHQPDPNTWSPLMVAKHVMLAEGYAAQYVRKKLSFNPEIAKAGIQSRLRSLALYLYFKSPIKRRAPVAIGDEAVLGDHQLAELKTEWLEQRAQLQQLLNELPAHRFEEEVYKHPFAGRMSISGMLRFFKGHFERHRKQLESRLED